jgi:hypothetical protein
VDARFSLQQFSEVFQVRNSSGLPYVLIGGQAVNYWAERYLAVEPELRRMLPFTSEDIDFKGNRDDVRHIAEQLKLTPVYPHPVEMTALAGAIFSLSVRADLSASCCGRWNAAAFRPRAGWAQSTGC